MLLVLRILVLEIFVLTKILLLEIYLLLRMLMLRVYLLDVLSLELSIPKILISLTT